MSLHSCAGFGDSRQGQDKLEGVGEHEGGDFIYLLIYFLQCLQVASEGRNLIPTVTLGGIPAAKTKEADNTLELHHGYSLF